MPFSEKLRHYRKRAGYKQAKDFANVLGISYTTYLSYEVEEREPRYNNLCKIATALGVTTDELLGHKTDGANGYEHLIEACSDSDFVYTVHDNEDGSIDICITEYDHELNGESYNTVSFESKKEFCSVMRALLNQYESITESVLKGLIVQKIRYIEVQQTFDVIEDDDSSAK